MGKKKHSKSKNKKSNEKNAPAKKDTEKLISDDALRSEAENKETTKQPEAEARAENSEIKEAAETKTAKTAEKADEKKKPAKTKKANPVSSENGKGFVKTLFEKYKEWLYKDPPEEDKGEKAPKVWPALILPALVIIFGLYYIGVFDVAFIPRPQSWETNFDRFLSIGKPEEPKEEIPEDTETEPSDTESADIGPDVQQSIDLKDTVTANRNEQKINNYTVFKTDDELISEGYYITDGTYDSYTCEVGLMTYDFELPRRFSYRDMTVRDWVITEYDDGRMPTVEDTEVTEARPALYPYMGYIIYDDANQELYLLDYNGKVLMRYNENYIPAFARTKDGKPLFYNTYRYYAETPVSVTENEAGEEVVTDAKGVYLTGKNYFTLSAAGTSFVKTDYIEERDGRGLNFDFEDSFGLSDVKIKRVGVMSPKFTTFLNGKSALVNFMNWNYFLEDDPNIPVLEDIIAKEAEYNALPIEEKLKLIEAKQTPSDLYGLDTLLPYSAAYNYNEKYAVVETSDTGEDPKYETKELRVINNLGEVQFVSKKEYYNTELKDYCSDRYLPPLSKGEDSIGHLYFDHGLLRLRKVTFDQFQLDEFGVLRVNMDRDVLVYPNGREFPIPDGYTLKGYSDGIMVLERNGLYGYMDYTGRWIAQPEYEMAKPFYSGVGVVTRNGISAALDVNGNYVLPFRYTYISNRSDGIITAFSETKGWEVYGIFTK
ncbi:MAG: WG repeat-containing protein [Ruminococcaceae bacterium]|nr:WG repeat-containing protein [Oscillospiraceae bacterium]